MLGPIVWDILIHSDHIIALALITVVNCVLTWLLQALFDLEATNQELKGDLRDLYITGAAEIDVGSSSRKAIVIHVRFHDGLLSPWVCGRARLEVPHVTGPLKA